MLDSLELLDLLTSLVGLVLVCFGLEKDEELTRLPPLPRPPSPHRRKQVRSFLLLFSSIEYLTYHLPLSSLPEGSQPIVGISRIVSSSPLDQTDRRLPFFLL